MSRKNKSPKIAVLFGTRPELIKLAPVIAAAKTLGIDAVTISSSQHTDLLKPFIDAFSIRIDHDLRVMRAGQSPNDVASRAIARLHRVLTAVRPDLLLVQGDTTTALAGAIAAFNLGIRVGHVEAGLRSGDPKNPFPEEMNRRLITRLADLHFAATTHNRETLIAEGVSKSNIAVTGNPVVDSLLRFAKTAKPNRQLAKLIESTSGTRRILLTTHRRESFGSAMEGNLRVLREFIESRADLSLLFPVHPNPNVRKVANSILGGIDRVFLLEPLGYSDFIALVRASWLIVSDSGGVQEEAPSFGKPLLVIRANTERPEALEAGVAKLVGDSPKALKRHLEHAYGDETWINSVKKQKNPFGDGRSAERIVKFILRKI